MKLSIVWEALHESTNDEMVLTIIVVANSVLKQVDDIVTVGNMAQIIYGGVQTGTRGDR
jgi:hypothetical protein